MVVGAGMYVFGVQKVAPWIFSIGVIRRLRRIMLMADVCFMLSAVFMVENGYNFLLPTFCKSGIDGYNAYLLYIHNNWVVLLLIAAILELYSTHRISNELEKEAKKP